MNTTTAKTTSITVKQAYERLVINGEQISLQWRNHPVDTNSAYYRAYPGIKAAIDRHNNMPPRPIVDIRPYVGGYILDYAEADADGRTTSWEHATQLIELVQS